MASKLTIEEWETGDVTILTLAGEMVLDDGDLEFRKRIHALVARDRVKIILDLQQVHYIDSAGVGMIAGKLKTVRERGGDLKLLRLNTRSQRLFGMMKLLIAFETFDDTETAVRSFDFSVR